MTRPHTHILAAYIGLGVAVITLILLLSHMDRSSNAPLLVPGSSAGKAAPRYNWLRLDIQGVKNTVRLIESTSDTALGSQEVQGVTNSETFFISPTTLVEVDINGIENTLYISPPLTNQVSYQISGMKSRVIFE